METSVSRVTALSWNRDPGDTCPPRSNSSSSVLSSLSSTSPSTQSQLELVRACQSWLEAILARPELTLPAQRSHLNHQTSPSPSTQSQLEMVRAGQRGGICPLQLTALFPTSTLSTSRSTLTGVARMEQLSLLECCHEIQLLHFSQIIFNKRAK